jgi:hypothetical protein
LFIWVKVIMLSPFLFIDLLYIGEIYVFAA